MPNLRSLSLGNCGLNGIIPEGLCQLKHLNQLSINDNDLDGMLPGCLANLTSLQTLDVSSNFLSGNISSSSLTSLTSIRYLDISSNNFQIPISLHPLFNLTKLKLFDAGSNQIYWEEETNDDYDLTPKFQLEYLNLSGHYHGGGTLPKFLYHQRSLNYIDLSHTRIFEGKFPHWLLDNNTELETLVLINNTLSGPFPSPSHPHNNFLGLDISDNLFHGQIPAEIRTYFPKLSFLKVNKNSLNGSIPSSIGRIAGANT
ncbi:hypothetical protein Tsubulata_045505 [Turnera subulata]|uniref:Leucine-rich repeat-containing N-terminal plant-type domain-containing protein n=1 Tax=Turnera subulata TaxID=218843 RepID=A0A9Q0G863_9ROSI|nr:hypothetical protein Tsubulata_045505 [Turnera subulata]